MKEIPFTIPVDDIVSAISGGDNDPTDFVMAVIRRVGDEGFATDLIRKISAWLAESCEDEDDFREIHDLIAAELEDEFRWKF